MVQEERTGGGEGRKKLRVRVRESVRGGGLRKGEKKFGCSTNRFNYGMRQYN